jgi:hypothetical protein
VNSGEGLRGLLLAWHNLETQIGEASDVPPGLLPSQSITWSARAKTAVQVSRVLARIGA